MSLEVAIGIFVFITGICIGSFLNVVILRALSGESIIFPASKCPKCQKSLKVWHNIPILSYILLKGKCAYCKEKISIQYPIIEFLTGYFFLSTYIKFGLSLNSLFLIIFECMFIVIATTDIKEQVSFDLHCYILAIAGLVYNFFNIGHLYSGQIWIFNTSFVASILGLLLGAAAITIYLGLGYLTVKTMIIGPGDIFIAGALGACFGWKHILWILITAFIIQILLILPIYLFKLIKEKDYLTSALLSLFLLITTIYTLISRYTNAMNNIIIYILLTLILVSSGILVCRRMLKKISNITTKNEETEPHQNNTGFKIAFGPALVISGIFFIFIL